MKLILVLMARGYRGVYTDTRPNRINCNFLLICLLLLTLCAKTALSKPFDYDDYDAFENNDFDEYDEDEADEDDDDEFGYGDVYDFDDNDDDGKDNSKMKEHWPKKTKMTHEQVYGDDAFHLNNYRKVKSGLFSDERTDFENDRPVHGMKPKQPLYDKEVKHMLHKPGNAYGHPKQTFLVRKHPYDNNPDDTLATRGKSTPSKSHTTYEPEYEDDPVPVQHPMRKPYGSKEVTGNSKEDSFDDHLKMHYKVDTSFYEEDDVVEEDEDMTPIESFKEAQKQSDGLHFFSSNRNEI